MRQKNTFFVVKKALLIGMLLVVQNTFAKDLNWTKEAPKRMNWFNAKKFCEEQNARLPKFEELKSVWLKNNKNSEIDGFEMSVSYWTSKEEPSRKQAAYPFYFGEGDKGWYYKADHYGVRCIKN